MPAGPKETGNSPMDEASASEPAKTARSTGKPPALDPALQSRLGRKLREHYDDLVREPVPGDLLQLLEELDRKEKDQESAGF